MRLLCLVLSLLVPQLVVAMDSPARGAPGHKSSDALADQLAGAHGNRLIGAPGSHLTPAHGEQLGEAPGDPPWEAPGDRLGPEPSGQQRGAPDGEIAVAHGYESGEALGDELVQEKPGRRRSHVLEAQRRAKMDSLRAPEQNVLEKGLLFFETSKVIDRLRYGYYGFFVTFGGLSTNSGLALGLRYENDEVIRNSSLFWSFRLSWNKHQQYQAGINTRPIDAVPLYLRVNARYRNFPQEEYFGLGMDSSRMDRSNFRLEDFSGTAGVGARPLPALEVGLETGYLRSRTGAGRSREVPSLDKVFAPEAVPGFSESVDYWRTALSVALDYRDSKGNPRSGGALFIEHAIYNDQHGDTYGFEQSSAELQGYMPFLHKHRVIALRAHVSDAGGSEGGTVPFQFLPHVGGSESIRGFREYRFRDAKLILANLEYRFEAFIGLDVALFGDFGEVERDWDDFRTADFEYSYGGGLRFNTAYSVFMRLDVGHGKEGTRFYWKFKNVF